jgi:hypothetical protein
MGPRQRDHLLHPESHWNTSILLREVKRIKAEMASSEARGEAIVTEERGRVSKPAVHEWERTLDLRRRG